jgi:WD40 repeat protein
MQQMAKLLHCTVLLGTTLAAMWLASRPGFAADDPKTVIKERHSIRVNKLGVTAVAFSPDGKTVASGGGDTSIRLWNVVTGKLQSTFEGQNAKVWSLAFSPDGKTLAAGDDAPPGSIAGRIKLWDVATGKEKATLSGHTNHVVSLAFSDDGKTLASASFRRVVPPGNKAPVKGEVKLWDAATRKPLATLEGTRSVAFTSDSALLAFPAPKQTIALWDIAAGKARATLKDGTYCLCFSPDGKMLASASADKSIKLWNVATDKQEAALKGHTSSVGSLAFSPDGKILASAGSSTDTAIKLWDVAGRKELVTLNAHAKWVFCVTFSQDGKMLASASGDGTIRLWDVQPGK